MKKYLWVSSAAVVTGALRVKSRFSTSGYLKIIISRQWKGDSERLFEMEFFYDWKCFRLQWESNPGLLW